MMLTQLPPEILHQTFEYLADELNLRNLLQLRYVCSLFDVHIMHETVFPRRTLYLDIVNCKNKDTIKKYLRWNRTPRYLAEPVNTSWPETDPTRNVQQVMTLLQSYSAAFVCFSKSKYTLESVRELVYDLFAQQLLVQPHEYQPHMCWSTRCRRFREKFLYWCPGELDDVPRLSMASCEQACVVIACALGDIDLLDGAILSSIEAYRQSSKLASEEESIDVAVLNSGHILGHPLQAAVWYGHHETISLLLARGSRPVYSITSSILRDAVLFRQYEILRRFLTRGPQPCDWIRQIETYNDASPFLETSSYTGDALAMAYSCNDRTAVEILRPHVQQPLNRHEVEFILYCACDGGAEALGLELLSEFSTLDASFFIRWWAGGFRPKVPDACLRYPVAAAAAQGCASLLKALLQRGATTKTYWPILPSAIQNAARHAHLCCLKVLVEAGVDGEESRHAAYDAMKHHHVECVEFLRKHHVT